MTSIHRPWRSAMARASSARTSGLTSLAARLERVRARLAPSPMITAALGGRPATAAASPPGATRISSSRVGGEAMSLQSPARLGRLVRLDGRSTSGRTSPRRRRGRPVRRRARPRRRAHRRRPAGSARSPGEWTVRPPSRRSAEAATRTTVSRSSVAGSPMPTTSRRPAGTSPARRERGRRSACRRARRTRRAPRARRRSAGRARRAARRTRAAGDRDDEDVGGDVPRLVGDDTKLHGRGILRRCGRPRDSRSRAAGWFVGGQCTRRSGPQGAADGSVDGLGDGAGARASASCALASSMAMTAPFIPPRPISP